MSTVQTKISDIKWPEIFSLAALNVSVVISWIAYHEYQPILLENFKFDHLADFLVVTTAIVLILIPPIAGLLADFMLKKNGKFFILFTVGIGATAMIFMIVASIIGAGPVSELKPFLPYMIILWLISMNLFISPAYSMIEAFAPAQKLPIVMGFLFLVTELVYALEPLVVGLVQFFGDTLTFIVGGVLISVSGFFFHKISSDEVITRKKELLDEQVKPQKLGAYAAILIIGLCLGIGKAFLVEFFPENFTSLFPDQGNLGNYISFGLLGFSAIIAFVVGKYITRIGIKKVILISFGILAVGSLILLFSTSMAMAILGGIVTAIGFSLLNVSGLPFAISQLSVKHITYGVGIYIGASEFFSGLFEYMYR
jgi:MFS family permease